MSIASKLSGHRKDIVVALGAAACLGKSLCEFAGISPKASSMLLGSSSTLFFLAAVVIIMASANALGKEGPRRALAASIAIGGIVVALAAVVSSLGLFSEAGGLVEIAVASIDGALTGALFLHWNYHIAGCSKDGIFGLVGGTTLLTLVFFCAVGLCGQYQAIAFHLLLAVSGLLCLYVETGDRQSERLAADRMASDSGFIDSNDIGSEEDANKTKLVFFGTRIVWGIVFGIAYSLAMGSSAHFGFNGGSTATIAVCLLCAALIAYAYWWVSPKRTPYYFLIALPLIMAMVLFLLARESTACLFCGMSWFAWYIQSYAQLPTYQRLTRMSLAPFAYYEKGLTLIPFSFASLATSLFLLHYGLPSPGAVKAAATLIAAVLILFALVSLCRSIMLYLAPQQKSGDFATGPSNRSVERAVAEVSGAYSLTPREEDVLLLLARGYSRRAVEEKLCISTGTARTHMRHIYQKINVASQDDLIAMIETHVARSLEDV